MPSTYTLISSNVLSSSAASVTFSAIPSTYTDLVLRISGRISVAATDWNVTLKFNSDGSTNYSDTQIYGNGSTVTSARESNQTVMNSIQGVTATNATANTFGSLEIYIPNYTVSANKPLSAFGMPETNATTFDLGGQAYAGLWRNTAAITSILIAGGGQNFVSGSSFYLYGISKS
jgi:hypothetical protein